MMVNKVDQKEGGRLDAGCSLKHMFWMGHTGVFVFCGGDERLTWACA